MQALLWLLLVASPGRERADTGEPGEPVAAAEGRAAAPPVEVVPPTEPSPSPSPDAVPEPDPPAEPEPPPAPVEPSPVEPVSIEPAAEPTPVPPPGATAPPARSSGPPRTWMVGAFVDAGYAFGSTFPDNHVNRGSSTAPRIGEFTVPLAVAHLRHDATDDEPLQLELALQFGPAATALVAADPLPGGEASRFTGIEVWQHVGRANVGGRIPRTGTEIAAGVFGTPIGYWSFWPKDNWIYTTPWHLNAVPYVLMGGRVLQPVGERVVLHAWVVNGWQTYADQNRVPSYMAGAIGTPVDGLQLGQFVYFGPEDRDPSPRAFRVLSDTWLTYDAGRWGLSAVFDVMRERLTLVPEEPVALYVVGSLMPRVRLWQAPKRRAQWLLAARGEAFWDRDGRMYGVDQLLGSASVNTDVDLFGHLLLRLEYRYDRSTSPAGFFYRGAAIRDTDAGLGREQHGVFLMATGRFEHWFRARPKPRT